MKPLNVLRAVGMSVIVLILLAGTGYAFHEGGEGFCDGCHGKSSGAAGRAPSAICLDCHSREYQVLSADGSAYTPGGDFFWLKQDYGQNSEGFTHGHNVVAREYGLRADPALPVAPGDGAVVFPSSELACTSCHDPHARTGEGGDGRFRLLGGKGYVSLENPTIVFERDAPAARSISGQAGQWTPEGDGNHTDYGLGMSEWCSNCHSGYSENSHLHPSGEKGRLNGVAGHYNSYISSGDFSGDFSEAYDFLVPFGRNTEEAGLLDPTSRAGAAPDDQVMCLTCHRAHASAFSSIGRWDFSATFLKDSIVLSSPEGRHAYYGEDVVSRYGSYQRSLCNKCHGWD